MTTQQVADQAGVAIGTLHLYASTKAELLILVQNQKFAAAIDDGLAGPRAISTSISSTTKRIAVIAAVAFYQA